MSKRDHGFSFGKEHGHHKHDGFGGHHHGKHDFLFGSRADDILNGTDKGDVIVGRNGNDQLFGHEGNDWLDGGRGNDLLDGGDGNDKLFGGNGRDLLLGGDGNDKLFGGRGDDVLDGGAGSDKGYGGKGNDTVIYTLAENTGLDACGNETRDYFDGGKGKDTLHLILTKEEFADPEIQAELQKYQDFLDQNPGGCGRGGEVFEFTKFGLTVRNFEELVVETGNTPPVANPDDYTVSEDPVKPLTGNVLDNDTDADGDALSAVLVPLSGPTHGTLNLSADGSFSYMPDADYYGPDQFSYYANDGADDSDPATVEITVLPVNDKPIVVSDDVQLSRADDLVELSPGKFGYVIDVLANDSPGPGPEADDQTLVVRPAGGPPGPFSPTSAGGTWTPSPDMTMVWYFPPTPDYVGDDSFRYAALDDGFPPMSTSLNPMDPVDIHIV